jgi:competence CoiA-like predicted nuclease
MLTAKYIDTNEEVVITDYENPRENLLKENLCCKFCEGKISIRQGLIRCNHFYHLNPCTSDFERHPESIQHNIGKQLIAEHIKQYWQEYASTNIKFEMPLKEIKRIADIAMIFPSGWIVVHEIQLATITTEQLQKRTNDYQSIGIDTFWWLGKGADSTANRNWCIQKFGYSLCIDYAVLDARAKDLRKGKTK